MYPSVCEVTSHEDFSLSIVLDNGEKRFLDMKPYLDFGVFKKVREYEKFKRVRVAFDTIEWDEDIDLDSEFICAKSEAECVTLYRFIGDFDYFLHSHHRF